MATVDYTSGDLSRTTSLPSQTAFTGILWVYEISNPGLTDWTLISLDNGSTGYLQIGETTTGPSWALWSDGGARQPMISEDAALGQWVRVALVGAPTTSYAYWQPTGGAFQSKSIASSTHSPTRLSVNNDGFAAGRLPCAIARIELYGRAMVAAEVLARFNAPLTAPPPGNGLIFWNANDDPARANIDFSPSRIDLTAAGSLARSPQMPQQATGKQMRRTNRIISQWSAPPPAAGGATDKPNFFLAM